MILFVAKNPSMQGEYRRGQSCEQKKRWGRASRRAVKQDRQADCSLAHDSGQLQLGLNRAGNGPISFLSSVYERTPCRTIALATTGFQTCYPALRAMPRH